MFSWLQGKKHRAIQSADSFQWEKLERSLLESVASKSYRNLYFICAQQIIRHCLDYQPKPLPHRKFWLTRGWDEGDVCVSMNTYHPCDPPDCKMLRVFSWPYMSLDGRHGCISIEMQSRLRRIRIGDFGKDEVRDSYPFDEVASIADVPILDDLAYWSDRLTHTPEILKLAYEHAIATLNNGRFLENIVIPNDYGHQGAVCGIVPCGQYKTFIEWTNGIQINDLTIYDATAERQARISEDSQGRRYLLIASDGHRDFHLAVEGDSHGEKVFGQREPHANPKPAYDNLFDLIHENLK